MTPSWGCHPPLSRPAARPRAAHRYEWPAFFDVRPRKQRGPRADIEPGATPFPRVRSRPLGRSRFNDSSGLAVVLVLVAVAGAQRGSVKREAPAGVSVGAGGLLLMAVSSGPGNTTN
jgi:hypothetical protein